MGTNPTTLNTLRRARLGLTMLCGFLETNQSEAKVNMSSVVCIIPARGGSKSIPNKNIKELGGKPLIVWSIEDAKVAGFSRIIVSTDSKEIADIARDNGAEVMYVSPIKAKIRGIHQDKSSMYQVLKSEIPRITPLPDYVMLLQPTTPFRNTLHTKIAMKLLPSSPEYDSLVSVERVPDKYNPGQVIIDVNDAKRMLFRKSTLLERLRGKVDQSFGGYPLAQRLTRRQDHPTAWVPTGAIYMLKTSNLKTGSIYGSNVMLIEGESTHNINTQEDWDEAESWLKSLQK